MWGDFKKGISLHESQPRCSLCLVIVSAVRVRNAILCYGMRAFVTEYEYFCWKAGSKEQDCGEARVRDERSSH